MAPPLFLIGTGVSPEDLTARHLALIEAADILVAGKRTLAAFSHLNCEKRPIDKDLSKLGDFLEQRMADCAIVVLASGDPLFFGIGNFLEKRLEKKNIRILPNVSAVAHAFARIGESWHAAKVVSLHGRCHMRESSVRTILGALSAGDPVAVYTDATHTPAWMADVLLENGFSQVSIYIMENLGSPDEKISCLTPETARTRIFSDLNIVILKPGPLSENRPALFPGMPDEAFAHEKGLITKAEVRVITLSRLQLFDSAVFWDLGAGSGSISIEAGSVIHGGHIIAVEQNASRIGHIEENRKRFGVTNLEIVSARLPDGLAELPDPDRIFVGGGGKNIGKIVRSAAKRLKPGGIIGVNTVLMDSLMAARQALTELEFSTDLIQIQVNQATPMPFSFRLRAANPVWVMTGRRLG